MSNLLQLVHNESFKLDDLKSLLSSNPDLCPSKLVYVKTGDSIIHIISRLGRSDFLNYLITLWGPTVVNIKNNDSKTPLHEACQFTQVETAEALIQNGADVNAIKRADWTPLMLTCTKTGDDAFKIVRTLIKAGALLNLRNKDGWTALHLASREGNVAIVEELLEGAELSRTKNGRTELHIAALHGHLPIVKLLLERIDPSSKDNSGNTALHEAVFSDNIELVDLLCERCNLNDVNGVGFGVLHLAASENLVNMIKHFVVMFKVDLNLKSLAGYTPLHCAARKKKAEAMKALVELGADIETKDNQGRRATDYFLL